MEEYHSSPFNLGFLDTLNQDALHEIFDSYNAFCNATQSLMGGAGDLSFGSEFVSQVHTLCKHGLESLVRDHFLRVLEVYPTRHFTSYIVKFEFILFPLFVGNF